MKPAPIDAQIADLRRRLGRGYVPHRPHPRQAEFLDCPEMEALYGGAAGGGKTDALLMAALQYAHVPGYSALILRRTFADLALPKAIMDRAREWLDGTDAVWHEHGKTWTFPSGASLTFGYCDTDRDRFRYQGAQIQFLGVDELTQWPEQWYRYLLSRLRRLEGMPVPIRARATANPGGIGHHWVYRRFVAAGAVGAFIPAKLADNPSLDAVEYRATLARLDAVTRQQLEDGIWIADGSGLVYPYDPARNRIDVAPPCDRTVLAMDFGVTNATSFTELGWRRHDPTVYVLRSTKAEGLIPSQVAEMVRGMRPERFDRIVGDVGGLGKAFAEEMRRRWNIPVAAAEKKNKRGYQALFAGALERGEIKIVASACADLEREWQELPWNEDRTAEASGFANHCADGTLYGWRECMGFAEGPAPNAETDEERMERLDEERYASPEPWWERVGRH